AASLSVSVPAASAAKVMSIDDAAPNPSVAAPSITAVPGPVTAPLIVMLPPWAQINPEFATSLFTISPPIPVASSVPVLVTTFAPVSMTRAWRPVATIVPSLTSVICPTPSWPAPEMVLSTLVSVTLGAVPEMKFSPLSDNVSRPLPWSVIPYWMSCRCVSLRAESSAMVPALLIMPASGSSAPSPIVMVAGLFNTGLIEYEVARGERRRGDAEERDRLAGAQRDHRVAGIVLGQMALHVIEVVKACIADQIDLVFAGIEAIDRVVSDRLCEDEEVRTTRAGQVIVARPGNDRRAWREHLDVVAEAGGAAAVVGVGPAHRHLERHRARVVVGRGDGERRDIAGLDRPAAMTVVDAPAHGPAGGDAGGRPRDRTQVAGGVAEAEVDGAAGDARRKGVGGEF